MQALLLSTTNDGVAVAAVDNSLTASLPHSALRRLGECHAGHQIAARNILLIATSKEQPAQDHSHCRNGLTIWRAHAGHCWHVTRPRHVGHLGWRERTASAARPAQGSHDGASGSLAPADSICLVRGEPGEGPGRAAGNHGVTFLDGGSWLLDQGAHQGQCHLCDKRSNRLLRPS